MEFSGTILFVSHDRFFINKLADRICEIENRRVVDYYGNYEYYREKKDESSKNKIEPLNKEKEKKLKDKANTKKQLSNNKIKEAEMLEKTVAELEEKLKAINNEMVDSGSNYDKLLELEKERVGVQAELDSTLEKWMEIESL